MVYIAELSKVGFDLGGGGGEVNVGDEEFVCVVQWGYGGVE